MATVLTGSRAKLKRGNEHFNAIQNEFGTTRPGRFWKANADFLRKEVEGEGREHSVYLRLVEEPDTRRWGLMFGDCIHNLRCALDHAVYELAILGSGKNPPPDKRALQFPITSDSGKWADAKWHIKSLTDDVQRIIECAQPYRRGDKYIELSPLTLLRDLDDADKHRLITPTMFNAATTNITVDNAEIPPENRPRPDQLFTDMNELKNDTKIASLTFTEAHPDVKVKFGVEIVVGVPLGRTLPDGTFWAHMEPLLWTVSEEVARIVAELEATA